MSKNRSKLNLFLDLAITLLFVLTLEVQLTGINRHELFGLALGGILFVHIVLHWRWIVAISTHFFRKVFHETRLNYLLNMALFVDMAVIIVTGLMISKTLGYNLELDEAVHRSWQNLHYFSSQFSLVLVGLHLGLHWKWLLTHMQKYLLPKNPFRSSHGSALVAASSKTSRKTIPS